MALEERPPPPEGTCACCRKQIADEVYAHGDVRPRWRQGLKMRLR